MCNNNNNNNKKSIKKEILKNVNINVQWTLLLSLCTNNNPRLVGILLKSIKSNVPLSPDSQVGWLFGVYGISTFVGYFMTNPFLCK